MKEKLWTANFTNVCVANFLLASSYYLLMPTIPIYLTETLKIEHSKVGVILSTFTLGMLLIRPFSGYLIDLFDRKKFLLISLILFVGIFPCYLYANAVAILMLVRFIHGLFWGMTTVSANTVAIDIIPSPRRAEGIGFFGMNMNLAMAIAPFIAMNIFNAYGFHNLIFYSIGMGVIAIIAVIIIAAPQKARNANKPPLSLDRFILIKGLPIFFNQVMVTIGWGMLLSFAVIYGKEIGIENAGEFFLFIAAGIILSRVISGRFVDRGHIHVVAVTAICLITISLISFSLLHSVVAYCTSAFFIGIGFGTMLPAFQTIFINMAPNDRRGTANSTYLTGFDLGIGIGMLLGGFFSESHPTEFMYLVAAGLSACSIFVYLFVSIKVYEKHRLNKTV